MHERFKGQILIPNIKEPEVLLMGNKPHGAQDCSGLLQDRQAIMETAAQLAINPHARLRTKENQQTASVHTVCLLLKP